MEHHPYLTFYTCVFHLRFLCNYESQNNDYCHARSIVELAVNCLVIHVILCRYFVLSKLSSITNLHFDLQHLCSITVQNRSNADIESEHACRLYQQ